MDSDITDLNEELIDLQDDYDHLRDVYENLTHDYLMLIQDYELESTLHIGNLLASFYDDLRTALGPTGGAWTLTEQEFWAESAEFATNLGMHDQGRVYWSYLDAAYYSIEGEHTCETAERIFEDIMGYIDFLPTDSSLDKMNKILLFVNEIVEYQYDMNDVFHSPLETLTYKSGDCDDFTILVSAMFEEIGIESAVGLFLNEAIEGHAMVLVKLSDLGSYGGYYYYSDLTSLGLEAGDWVIIEPQTTLDNQHTSWNEQWSLYVASELDFHG